LNQAAKSFGMVIRLGKHKRISLRSSRLCGGSFEFEYASLAHVIGFLSLASRLE
jgi:hypothetical protein